MARIEIDTDDWPLVVIRFPARSLTDDALHDALAQLGSYPNAKTPYATLTDLSDVIEPLSGRQLWVHDEWMRRNLERFREATVANACVAPSPVSRNALDSVYWHWEEQPGFRTYEKLETARSWLLHKLASVGASQAQAPTLPPIDMPPFPPACANIMEMFSEPAFLVTHAGEVAYANRAAQQAYEQVPSWVSHVVDREGTPQRAAARIARVDGEDDLLIVVPNEGAALAGLPPSLERIARLLSRGLSDKEIAADTELTLSTVHTYIRRLYQRAGVHSRSELASLWFARAGTNGR